MKRVVPLPPITSAATVDRERSTRCRITLIRNATLLLEIGGRRVLVDPALDEPGARTPIEDTADERRNPLVPANDIVRDLDGVLVTHLHRDHFDETGERLLPRELPVSVSRPIETVWSPLASTPDQWTQS